MDEQFSHANTKNVARYLDALSSDALQKINSSYASYHVDSQRQPRQSPSGMGQQVRKPAIIIPNPNHLTSTYTLPCSIPPVVHINSGDTVSFDCLDASNGQITPTTTPQDLARADLAQMDQVCGPVAIAGAEPGDTLQVDVLSIETAEWGWTALIPGFGLLADEFKEPALKIWTIDKEKGYAWFDEGKGIRIPIRPFAGEMGVARGVKGAFSTIPPYNTGVS